MDAPVGSKEMTQASTRSVMTGLNHVGVTVVGLSHLGMVTSACLSGLGYRVVGVDLDRAKVQRITQLRLPVFEPGLEEKIRKGLSAARLSFSSDPASGLKGASYVIFASDTPVGRNDSPDLKPLLDEVRRCVPFLEDQVTIIVSSQVPVGTCGKIIDLVRKRRPRLRFALAYVPENLRLGEAIQRFEHPDVVVMGSNDETSTKAVEWLYQRIESPKVVVPVRTAEMVKHAINAYLAMRISFANEIANLSERLGVDGVKVAEVMRLDKRIGKNGALTPGLGFSGGTLARDVKTLQRLGDGVGFKTYLMNGIIEVNRKQNERVVEKLKTRFGRLKGLRVGVLGLAYKPGTSSIRRSASVEIVRMLKRRGVEVRVFDPMARKDEARRSVGGICEDVYQAAHGADALLLLTAWPIFRQLDYGRLASMMRRPFILDAQNLLADQPPETPGLNYVGIGRGSGWTDR